MKMCTVCGYSAEDTIEDCANCGSRSFKTIEPKNSKSKKLKRTIFRFTIIFILLIKKNNKEE